MINKKAILRIINTIATYIGTDKYDGVYEDQKILDLLCDDLRAAIHSNDDKELKQKYDKDC